MNGLENLLAVLEAPKGQTVNQEVLVDDTLREDALRPLQRMLDFTANTNLKAVGNA